MALLGEEPKPKVDAEGNKQGMSSETVDSKDVVGSMDVSKSKGNVVDAEGILDEGKEIVVSMKSDVPDDSKLPELVSGNLQVESHDLDMRNESDGSSALGRRSMVLSGKNSNSVGQHYDVGDMVWGKVKSHPWWPGHIYSETLASPEVLKTKKAGHFLVAFYGDSSYGWFHPEELLPFEDHFAEKSQQLNTKVFIKAVDEAIDEISRRWRLGLLCRCRNPHNFRPTPYQGFLAVNVNEYESASTYSVKQIEKARDQFQPTAALDFIKMAAVRSTDLGMGTISLIKNKAIALSYRKAVFEEFDETYAQAFGQKADRPPPPGLSLEDAMAHTSVEEVAKAGLSGPLVIAQQEPLNKRKPTKTKDVNKNKDKYLFKRREDPTTTDQKRPKPKPIPTAYVEGSKEVSSGDFILQKRTPPVPDTEVKGNVGSSKKPKAFKRPVEMATDKSSTQAEKKKKVKKLVSEVEKKGTDGSKGFLEEANLPDLLHCLRGLAIDPFHSCHIYSPLMVKNTITQFRSHVFQKSLSSTPTPTQDDIIQHPQQLPKTRTTKPVDTTKSVDTTKHVVKKRELSDRQEESAAKRVKKLNDLKSQKTPPKPDIITKPVRIRQPTALLMKFPPHVSLPSASELKARLARFGPLDQSGTRIFYTTYTCRVVFLYKNDAVTANNQLTSGKSCLFGNVQLKCHIRDMSSSLPDPEPNKPQREEASIPTPMMMMMRPKHPQQQLKSCLKRPNSEENSSRVAGRVKFAVDESPKGVSMGSSLASSRGFSSHGHGFDNNNKATSSKSLCTNISASIVHPNKPLSHKAVSNGDEDGDGDGMGMNKEEIFGMRLLRLMTICSEVVARVRKYLGYNPYHPL